MSFKAEVLRVAIASPSDVEEARIAVEKALHSWNTVNAVSKKTILLPWRWENSSVPLLGSSPQEVINDQGIDSADILIALFGSRLGAPTTGAVSGTVEEITRAQDSGKPVHVYFSTAPLPYDADTTQINGLREFKNEIQQRGLYGEFQTVEDLGHIIWRAVEYDVSYLATQARALDAEQQDVMFKVQPKEERLPQGIDKNGKMKYRTNHWYEITNIGNKIAKNVTFRTPDETQGVLLDVPASPISLMPATNWKVNAIYTLAMSQPRLVIEWDDDKERKQQIFDVQ